MKKSELSLKDIVETMKENQSTFSIFIIYGSLSANIRRITSDELDHVNQATFLYQSELDTTLIPNVKNFVYLEDKNEYEADYAGVKIRIYDIK